MNRFLWRVGRSSISTKKEQRLKMMNDQLSLMFSSEENKSVLSSVFQILPFYFSAKHLEKFTYSKNIEGYIEYINNKLPDKKKFAVVQRQYMKENIEKSVINCQNAVYLQAYMHWLTSQCSDFKLQNNDYLMEYIHLQNPQKLFQPDKNKIKRTFIYHHGPTNSGKSTSAIQQLKDLSSNQKGIYMAPLRLLAWEYHKKLGNCTLITGQQKQYKNSNLISCTIEAARLNEQYSVAVIDEIQMIADEQRGWAWTKAVLAIKAKRIHLCGDERAIGIVSKIIQQTGDILEERRYSRLSKLLLIHKNFRTDKIQAGDCIIDFSVKKVIEHRKIVNKIVSQKQKKEVQAKKKKRSKKEKIEANSDQPQFNRNYTALVYGKLPPESRKQQANFFNQRKLPYLVATNAIGMGLNLNIKKIIFMTLQKPSKDGQEELLDHQIQQIAGRAGRGTQTGYVQCLSNEILQRVKRALSTVNLQYGLQLQNIQDETGQAVNAEPQILYKKEKPMVFNQLLGRNMTQNERQIQRACFYFTSNYLIDCKRRISWLMGLDFAILDQIDFLKRYSKLNKLYFYQDTTHLAYLVQLLQKHQFDLRDLLLFYNGLSLSIPPYRRRDFRNKIKNAHRQFIQNFIDQRKVPLPGFLVSIYRYGSSSYQYMQQLQELQLYYNLLETYVWLWNKYEFAFYEVGLAKEIKIFLSNKISTILNQNKFLTSNKKVKQQAILKEDQAIKKQKYAKAIN